jgi:hypothetical protein
MLLPAAICGLLMTFVGAVEATTGHSEPRALLPAMVEVTAVSEASALLLDGDLTDEVWQRAPRVSGFLQREPKEGAAATYQTEFRVAYDANHLYVAVRALDPEPARLVGHLTRRDVESPSDWIRVVIDSFHDRRTAFEFAVNPAGVKQDRYWFDDANQDLGWDAVWDVGIRREERGWQAEFRIPFSQLRYRPHADASFGFAVVRQVGRLNETSSWPLLARSVTGYVSQFGELTGLSLNRALRRLELVPYAVSELITNPPDAGNPFVKTTDPDAEVGLDLRYAIGPGLTLTGTVNPDFGQVEADPAVVNLSAFETFFPERRPFFLEGAGVFRFDIDCSDDVCTGLFYSRRIGRVPQAETSTPDDGYEDVPGQTTILGAAKLTGRVGGFSVGALGALTAEETARFANADGVPLGTESVEPFTGYTVVRARREFANQSSLGFMTTTTMRRLDDHLSDSLAGRAYTGGADADWRLSSRYRVFGFWAGSTVRGSAPAITALQEDNRHLFQRPDAGHVDLDPTREALDGHAGQIGVGKHGGERTRFTSLYSFKSPGFEINDLGFQLRADEHQIGNWFQVRNERPGRLLRSSRVNFNQWSGWNFDGDRISFGGNVNAHAQFQNNWYAGAGFNLIGRTFDDRATRGGPGAYRNPLVGGWAYVESDNRRLLAFEQFGFYMRDDHGSSEYLVNPVITLRPASFLSMSAGARFSRNIDDKQWIENVEDASGRERYVFGHLDQTTAGLTFRLNYTMSPTLSLQVYAEPFVSAGDYWDFKELVDGRAPRYEDRYAAFAYESDPDFRYTSFRTTNVLRWEYRPGSTLFVVWQQGREDSVEEGDFRFGRDMGHVFSAPARNVFLIKLAYWINP